MLKQLTAIFRFFVPSKDEVIAKQIKNRHGPPSSQGNTAGKPSYQQGIDQSRFRGPGPY